MQISKETATKIAKEVCQPLYKQLEDTKKDIISETYNEVVRITPTILKKVLKEYPDEIHTSRCVYVNNIDKRIFNDTRFITVKESCVNKYTNWDNFSKEAKSKIEKMCYKAVDIINKIEKSETELITTLLSLKTYKRISENLPELVKYLPVKTNTQLIISLDKTKELIQCLNTPTSKCLENI